AILGGAKVSDKIEVIQNFLDKVDGLLIGGAMGYTFFKTKGVAGGRPLVEDDKRDAARESETGARQRHRDLGLPVDHIVTDKIEAGARHETLRIGDSSIGERMGVDIGPETVRLYSAAIALAKTAVWNGPMGVFEIPEFAEGTTAIARAMTDVRG